MRTTVEDPVALVTEILKEIVDTNVQRSRHLLRLIPIQKTCKAFEGPGVIILITCLKFKRVQIYKVLARSLIMFNNN